MEAKNLQNQKGFTLVEIAIVLVIIGLLLGGVLKGQELIENAKVKSLTNEFDNITAAYYAYQDRTSTFPNSANDSAFWFDLRTEGFVSGDLATSTTSVGPTHAFDGTFVFVPAATGNLIPNKNMICAPGVEDTVADNIDTKVDDGSSNTGTMRAANETAAGSAVVLASGVLGAYTSTDASLTLCKEL